MIEQTDTYSVVTWHYFYSCWIVNAVRSLANRLHSEQYHIVSFTNTWKKIIMCQLLWSITFVVTVTYSLACRQRKGDTKNEKNECQKLCVDREKQRLLGIRFTFTVTGQWMVCHKTDDYTDLFVVLNSLLHQD